MPVSKGLSIHFQTQFTLCTLTFKIPGLPGENAWDGQPQCTAVKLLLKIQAGSFVEDSGVGVRYQQEGRVVSSLPF